MLQLDSLNKVLALLDPFATEEEALCLLPEPRLVVSAPDADDVDYQEPHADEYESYLFAD